MENTSIKSGWELWYHSISDSKWDKKSYSKLYSIKSLYDVKLIKDTFKQNHYQNGMFFLMKDNVFPNWEDPNNRLGGCLSFKVPSNKIIEEWNMLLINCINETIMDNENGNINENDNINGISISPKKEFNIIKVWFRENPGELKDKLKSGGGHLNIDNSIYKKHIIN
tara:strand:+ start:323 stop:823 length:501 start_codon:yes stop_codon:yes gene_type:complete